MESLKSEAAHRLAHETLGFTWRGRTVIKMPADALAYAGVIEERRPDVIVETGTAYGGSARFFADMLRLFHPAGRVITIDVDARQTPDDPMVEYIEGSSVDPAIVSRVAEATAGKKTMVILDSDHHGRHVYRELRAYAPLVSVGQFVVVEDVYLKGRRYWPGGGIDRWRAEGFGKGFVERDFHKRWIFGVTRGGWMERLG